MTCLGSALKTMIDQVTSICHIVDQSPIWHEPGFGSGGEMILPSVIIWILIDQLIKEVGWAKAQPTVISQLKINSL